jgi:hypothetical protein
MSTMPSAYSCLVLGNVYWPNTIGFKCSTVTARVTLSTRNIQPDDSTLKIMEIPAILRIQHIQDGGEAGLSPGIESF